MALCIVWPTKRAMVRGPAPGPPRGYLITWLHSQGLLDWARARAVGAAGGPSQALQAQHWANQPHCCQAMGHSVACCVCVHTEWFWWCGPGPVLGPGPKLSSHALHSLQWLDHWQYPNRPGLPNTAILAVFYLNVYDAVSHVPEQNV